MKQEKKIKIRTRTKPPILQIIRIVKKKFEKTRNILRSPDYITVIEYELSDFTHINNIKCYSYINGEVTSCDEETKEGVLLTIPLMNPLGTLTIDNWIINVYYMNAETFEEIIITCRLRSNPFYVIIIDVGKAW